MGQIFAGVTKADYSIEDGQYPARLFQIIQLGSQRFEKNGKEWYSPQILLGFELPTLTYENMDGIEMANIKSGTYFLSMNPSYNGVAGLREIIDGLRGSVEYTQEQLEKFDISSFLGKECAITLSGVESKGRVYQNITKVEPCDFKKEGLAELKEYRQNMLVTVDDFKKLDELVMPDWIKEKIMLSKEYSELSSYEPEHNGVEEQELREEKELKLDELDF